MTTPSPTEELSPRARTEELSQHPRRCKAKNRRTKEQCRAFAVHGTTICIAHGAGNRHIRAKAKERVVEAKAQTVLARMDVEAVGDPIGELAKLAGRALAWERTIGDLVNELSDIRFVSETGVEQLNSKVAVLERAMDRAGQFLAVLAKLRLDTKIVQIREAEAAIVLRAIEKALDAAGVEGRQREIASRVAARELETRGTAA